MKQRKKPSLRFKGFDNDWEQRKLGDYITIISGDAPSKFDEGNELYVKVDDLNCNSKYVIDSKNKVALHESINKAPEGSVVFPKRGAAIMTNKVRILADDCYIDTNLMALSSNKIDSEFLYNIISKEGLYKIADTSTIPQINNKHIEPYEVLLPRLDEQRTIGKFFKDVDNFITLHQRKLEKLQNLKKAMLEKMFPKNGAKVPEIRFKGFTNDWEQRKLGAIFEEYSDKGHPNLFALTIIQGGGTIRRDDSDRNLQYDKKNLANYKKVETGDFIVHLRSFEGGLEKATTSGIISPAYHTFHGEGTDSRFYYCYFRSERFINHDLKPHVYGIRDGRSIDIEGMKTINIPWTKVEEQKAIGNYIDCLDNLLTLHQCKLEKLQNLKKAMLEKMFI